MSFFATHLHFIHFSFQFNLIIPITFLCAVLFLLIVPLFAAPKDTGMGLLLVLTGLPVYVIGVRWKSKPKAFTDFVGKFALKECLKIYIDCEKIMLPGSEAIKHFHAQFN